MMKYEHGLYALLTRFFFPMRWLRNFYSKERQFRVEQREADGSIKGEYGYVDQSGKMHLTKYSASEAEGFKSEQVPT